MLFDPLSIFSSDGASTEDLVNSGASFRVNNIDLEKTDGEQPCRWAWSVDTEDLLPAMDSLKDALVPLVCKVTLAVSWLVIRAYNLLSESFLQKEVRTATARQQTEAPRFSELSETQ